MRKYINIVSPIIIILSLLVGFHVYAETGEQGKDNSASSKSEVRVTKEERIKKLNELINAIKIKREDFKIMLEKTRERAYIKAIELKSQFKNDLQKIEDESKRTSSENIVNSIDFLNTKFTTNLSNKTDEIENILASIESRITKAEIAGLDISVVKPEVEKAKELISQARESIQLQVKNVYIVSITDEAALKSEMSELRNTFMTDIKAVREKVKQAHIAVRNAASVLSAIPKINEIDTANNVVGPNNPTETEIQGDNNTSEVENDVELEIPNDSVNE